jgi:lipoyl synthase
MKRETPHRVRRELQEKMQVAWGLTREAFGDVITFYVPGMFRYNGISGRYPAVSITGDRCALQCDHCRGSLLTTMPDAGDPERLLDACLRFKSKGHHGVLISGGCDEKGRLPWESFIDAISKVKQETGLYVTVHCGLVNRQQARLLKEAGVDQALLDVIGDDETYKAVYHVDFGVSEIIRSMEALETAGLEMVPHVVCGLHYGEMRGEKRALDMVASFKVGRLVIVAVMPPKATPEVVFQSPSPWEVADLIAEARLKMPRSHLSLGCARKRGEADMDLLAIRAGINRMAIPSEEALQLARELGLKARYQRTCCSVSLDVAGDQW